MSMMPSGLKSVFDSRHLHHLPWRPAEGFDPIPERKLVMVRGTTGMRHPKDEFLAIGYYDGNYHPGAGDHWYDTENDHFTDRGWQVTHWCEL